MEQLDLKILSKNLKTLNDLKDKAYKDKINCELLKKREIQYTSDDLKEIEEKLKFYNQTDLNKKEAKEKVANFNKVILFRTFIGTILLIISFIALGFIISVLAHDAGFEMFKSVISKLFGTPIAIISVSPLAFASYVYNEGMFCIRNQKEYYKIYDLKECLKLSKEELQEIVSNLEEKKAELESKIASIIQETDKKNKKYDELKNFIFGIKLRLNSSFSIKEKEELYSEVKQELIRQLEVGE